MSFQFGRGCSALLELPVNLRVLRTPDAKKRAVAAGSLSYQRCGSCSIPELPEKEVAVKGLSSKYQSGGILLKRWFMELKINCHNGDIRSESFSFSTLLVLFKFLNSNPAKGVPFPSR